jgi:hypothetical protein
MQLKIIFIPVFTVSLFTICIYSIDLFANQTSQIFRWCVKYLKPNLILNIDTLLEPTEPLYAVETSDFNY